MVIGFGLSALSE